VGAGAEGAGAAEDLVVGEASEDLAAVEDSAVVAPEEDSDEPDDRNH
jgi:hypothetical protein